MTEGGKVPKRITIIFKRSVQIGPDDWSVTTRRATITLTSEQVAEIRQMQDEDAVMFVLEHDQ